MKNAILLRILIVLVLLGGIFYITYNDYKQTKLPEDNTSVVVATSTPMTPPVVVINSPVDSKDKNEEIKDILAFPIPNLDRYYVVPVSLDKAMATQTVKEITSNVESLKKDPTQFGKWLDLALLRKLVEDYAGAEEIWVFTSKEWPDSSISKFNLADLYTFYLKDYPRAEINLKGAIEIEPHQVSHYRNLYNLYINQYIEKKSEALPVLLSGIKANPKSTDLLVLAGIYYKDAGDKTNAKKDYTAALSLAEAQKNTFLVDYLNKEIKDL